MAAQPPRSDLHEAALDWAALGFHVFPIQRLAKVPAVPNGHLHATTDPNQINTWWTSCADYNIGIVPGRSGCFVLDQDGPVGADSLARLVQTNAEIPRTLTVQTPSGPDRLHYYFEGMARSTVGTLGPKLDTRGAANDRYTYVLVPPSRTAHGEYRYHGETDEIARAPDWLLSKLGTHGVHEAPEGVEIDADHNISRAIAYLETTEPAIEGQGGDARTFQSACGLRDFGLSPEKALDLLKDYYNPRCIPPWTEEELQAKVENAYTYAQNEAGAYASPDPIQEFAHFAGAHAPGVDGILGEPKGLKRKRFTLMDETEMTEMTPANWLLKDLIQEKSLVLMYGRYESYKSFLALDMALTLASGQAGWDCPGRPGCPVVYAPSEGQVGIALQRKPAWRLARGIDGILPFYAFEDVPSINSAEDMTLFAEGIRAKGVKPKLIVIDTVANALVGLDEDSRGFGMFIQQMKTLRDTFECAILAVHHSGQDERRGPRGGTALPAGFDTILEVDGHHATRTVVVTVKKQKDAMKRTKPYHFKGEVVGPSLVFSPIEPTVYKALQDSDDTTGYAAIDNALRKLGATGGKAVPTMVLASDRCAQMPGDTQGTYERAVKAMCGRLEALAKDKLSAFAKKNGNSTIWGIPVVQQIEDDSL